MTKQNNISRMAAVIVVGLVAIVGLGLLLTLLGRGPGAPSLAVEPTAPHPDDQPVATVNKHDIYYSEWVEASLLDQVMSRLSGQTPPTPDETLQRLINESLVLAAFPPSAHPDDEAIAARIAALEQSWGADDATVQAALEQVGLTYGSLERAVGRLLEVQAALEEMESQGYDSTAWLEEQRSTARVEIEDDLVNATVPRIIAQAQQAAAGTAPAPEPSAPPTQKPQPTPSPKPTTAPTTAPTAASEAVTLTVAPDFSLPQAGGGTFTLTEQLKQGPVVLVFFQKCG